MSRAGQISNMRRFWWRIVKPYIDDAIRGIETFEQEAVEELPSVGRAKTLYFVPASTTDTNNYYNEYVYTSRGWEQVGSTMYVPDHSVDTITLSGKVVITKGGHSYAMSAEEIVKPAAPELPAGGDFYNSRAVAITAVSGATIYYTINGNTPTTDSTRYTSSITMGNTAVESTTYVVKAIAVKNGMTSDVATATYTCHRRVATPSLVSATGNKYSESRTITFACSTAGATIQYKIGSGEWQTGDRVTLTSTATITLRASKDEWVTSAESTATTYSLNAGKCYIGQATSITSEAGIKTLANAYERDTLVGWTAPTIDFGSTSEYVWFAIPSTAAKTLTIKSSGFGVTLDNAAGMVIGGWRVWRTANKLNSSFTFEFS